MTLCLRSRLLLTLVGPPIEDGAVVIAGDRIVWAGPWASRPADLGPDATVVDLGERILLPGLVNAHCHLDYTSLAGHLPPPRGFTDWIKGLVALKAAWTAAEFAASWRRGAEMLLRTGTTTVADIEAMPELLPAAWQATPLRVHSFRELIHLKAGEAPRELARQAAADLEALPGGAGRVGLSPHAPYSTTPELLNAAADLARRRGWRLTTHVAESEEEFEMFMYRQGAMFDWLKGQRDMADCGMGSPVQHLERHGYLEDNLLAVHVNHLWRHDAGILGRNQVSVAHCPRSHDYFRHLRFPREELTSAGVNLCLGTDSLASVRPAATAAGAAAPAPALELNLFAEMQQLLAVAPDLAPEFILQMATVNGARALGRAGEIGQLTPDALADLIAIPFSGRAAETFAAVIHHRGPIDAGIIGGHWTIRPQA